ncbi:GAF domain-containing protein [Desulfurivibrio sp. D14AmB]|uniref:GAF domain-containing protein n=1 Tax=Desulfurivibrio sp. D14AmB TaxID=3374370 RepID=UPI00376F27B2
MVASKQQKANSVSTDRTQPPSHPGISLLLGICREEYGRIIPRIKRLLTDVEALYAGEWPDYEACEVGYHDFAHALDAAVAVARMAAGWNRAQPGKKLDADLFSCAVAAGIFHDAGYIKDKGDHEGQGGKFTTTHVQRGMAMAAGYLKRSRWPHRAVEFVPATIAITDYHRNPEIDGQLFRTEQEITVARMIPTADLIAQIADNRYIAKLDRLFDEFKELYEFQEQRRLAPGETPVFRSAQEIRDGVIDFYEQFVVPRMVKFGRMDKYLAVYFGENRNPYHENIAANLSSHLLSPGTGWQRLGDALKGLGLIDDRQLETALARQRQLRRATRQPSPEQTKEVLLSWMDSRSNSTGDNLGNILVEMGALPPSALADGLAHQSLPDQLLASLSADDLRLLLRISALIQHLNKGPWLLASIMELLNRLLACETSSLLLAGPGKDETLVSLPTAPGPTGKEGRRVPMDKGLAGWVFRNGKPALAPNMPDGKNSGKNHQQDLSISPRSLLAVPLFINGACLGVLEAANKNSGLFNQQDLQKMTILANMLAGTLGAIMSEESPLTMTSPALSNR